MQSRENITRRLANLDEELGGGIHIHKVTNEQYRFRRPHHPGGTGKPYTVADNDVAQLPAHDLLPQPEYRTLHQL